MTPLIGQQVYSRDGTKWLGSVYKNIESFSQNVNSQRWVAVKPSDPAFASFRFVPIFEWYRSLGGWLEW